MKQGLKFIESALKPRPVAAPQLLVTLEPWPKVFFHNLCDFLRPKRQEPPALSSSPGNFWADVFVASRLPWLRFLESAVFHTAAILVLWSSAQLWPQRPRVVVPAAFHQSDVVYYQAAEYLPPLDTGGTKARLPQKADPEYSAQPIISVPPESDNRQQTIVTPPKLKLNSDVPLPNVVAWNQAQPTIPLAATARASELKLPSLPTPVVAPPPTVSNKIAAPPTMSASVVAPAPDVSSALSKREMRIPQAAVVEPPPSVETASSRKLGDINIGHAQVVAPAPQLPVQEQHALASLAAASLGNPGAAVVPPPPSMQGTGIANPDGRLIALGLHPAALTGPVEPPNGNRRGTLAATPEGKPGATGTPAISAGNAGSASAGFAKSGTNPNGVPPGLFVGASPKGGFSVTGTPGTGDDPALVASAQPPRSGLASRSVATEIPEEAQTETERKVFAGRKSYGMTLNVPNLNSAGGSWVLHFSELPGDDAKPPGDLLAPVATRAVDPGYPLELMRQNVQGTVTLSAIIHSDGHVADVKVLNGVDDRLDQYACAAFLRWQFLPALRNGNPVPLQAVVMIPFKARRRNGF